jgi:predicted alpha/beta-fold hydrolase
VQSEVDPEAVAIDIAFPPHGIHSTVKPVYLILHGLNGGSHEEYVREFVVRRTREGHTCIVMIARGLMDTPVFGWNVFHGARITDVDVVAKAIRKGLDDNQMLAGVGYSMGAIILSNYVARSGRQCHLDCAMAISGGLDMRENLNFRRSMRLWQPMLAQTLKEDFIMKKFDGRFRQRLTQEQHLALMRASSVSEVDVHAIVTYNGFRSLLHYYTEMSAMGDTCAFQAQHSVSEKTTGTKKSNTTTRIDDGKSCDVGRIGNVSIPFCVMHALDDPLTTWRTMGHDPQKLVETGSGHIMMFLTKSGGHVGWPLGLNPASSGWKFMNDAVSGFVNSVDQARMEMLETGSS